jgi:hypothetical protein
MTRQAHCASDTTWGRHVGVLNSSYVDLDLRSGTWRSLHPCAEDHYEIVTVVRSPDEVEERWRVRGPAKDYEAVTMLRRLDRPQEIDTYPLLERTAL